MTDSNRLRLAVVRETALGETPSSPRMRTARITGESLSFTPSFTQSEELRDDRMNADPIQNNETNDGGINFELSYPVDESPLSEFFRSLMFNAWMNTPQRDNDGTADSVITGVTAADDTFTVTTGDAFVEGMLVRATGFGESVNNGLFRATTGSSATAVVVGDTPGLVDEDAPAVAARLKVVGLEGAAGDLEAIADGISSTTLDFTTLGLRAGQWIKIGGTGSDFRFGTAENNGWARISGTPTANKLPLDNLPIGWSVDAGASKTLRIFFGDQIKNGTALSSVTIERGFMGQAAPTYIAQRGMVAGQAELNITTEEKIAGSFTFMGLKGEQSTTPLDPEPDPATTNRVMSANVNVGRIAEGGTALSSPNWVRSLQMTINNNLRGKSAADELGNVDIGTGDFTIEATVTTYFGNNALLAKLHAGAPSNLNSRIVKDNQALIPALPRVTFTGGNPNAGGKNQDVTLPLTAMVSRDPVTDASLIFDRLEYFED